MAKAIGASSKHQVPIAVVACPGELLINCLERYSRGCFVHACLTSGVRPPCRAIRHEEGYSSVLSPAVGVSAVRSGRQRDQDRYAAVPLRRRAGHRPFAKPQPACDQLSKLGCKEAVASFVPPIDPCVCHAGHQRSLLCDAAAAAAAAATGDSAAAAAAAASKSNTCSSYI